MAGKRHLRVSERAFSQTRGRQNVNVRFWVGFATDKLCKRVVRAGANDSQFVFITLRNCWAKTVSGSIVEQNPIECVANCVQHVR